MLLFYPDITGWFLQQPLQVRRWQCVQIQAALACKARDGRPRHLDMKDVSKQRIFSRYAICYPMLHPSGVAKSTHPSKSTSANKVLQRHAPNLMSSLAWHSHVEVSFRSALRSHVFFWKPNHDMTTCPPTLMIKDPTHWTVLPWAWRC